MEEIDLKMQQKGEEQVQRLEAMLQEQASKTEGHISKGGWRWVESAGGNVSVISIVGVTHKFWLNE